MVSKDCLVLNASWIPIETISWQDAFTKIFNSRAYAIEYYEDIVKTPSDEFLKPAVIVCVEYNKIPIRAPIYSKRMILMRDKYICQYCNKQLTSASATIDHIVPRSSGGRSTFQNTVCACRKCNSRKGNKSLIECKMKLLNKPGLPKINPVKTKFSGMSIKGQWQSHLKHYIGS